MVRFEAHNYSLPKKASIGLHFIPSEKSGEGGEFNLFVSTKGLKSIVHQTIIINRHECMELSRVLTISTIKKVSK